MRRKIVRKTKPSTAQDDKKLQGALKKLNVQPIPGVEEVNMFREDGNVLHFSTPKGTPRVHPYPIHLSPIPSSPLHTILSTICRSVLAPCLWACALPSGTRLRSAQIHTQFPMPSLPLDPMRRPC